MKIAENQRKKEKKTQQKEIKLVLTEEALLL